VNYGRTALLNDPDVIAHLLHLDDLREAARTEMAIAVRAGVDLGWELAAAASDRYERAREDSVLREQLGADELDYLVSIIRDRRRLEREHGLRLWGLSIPVNPAAAAYGREKQQARAMSFDAIELAVADLVRRGLNPERNSPHLDARTGHWGGACASLRKIRQRFRELPYR
jgi:hypothetical protein